MSKKSIKLTGVRQNNLKGFDLELPLNKIIGITGVSGSGKSSLAFDTLYAEGQRRYVETFSPYARQFMDRMDRPQVEKIEGIPPAIAIEHGEPVRTSRSTVGTMTEITDYAKLLYAHEAELYCRVCGRKVMRESPQTVFSHIAHFSPETIIITFPFSMRNLSREEVTRHLAGLGFFRILKSGHVELLEDGIHGEDELNVVVDRLIFRPEEKQRVIDSIEQAFRFGGGRISVHIPEKEPLHFSSHLECPFCDIAYRDPVPNLFSFNSPLGACETCKGFGRVIDVDIDLVIPDKNKTLSEGVVKPWVDATVEFEEMMNFCFRKGIPTDVPFKDLKKDAKSAIIDGDENFFGIRGFFRWLETKRYKLHVRVYLSRYRAYSMCPGCHGTRFKDDALLWKVKGKTISDVYSMSIRESWQFLSELDGVSGNEVTDLLLKEINARLKYLIDVGLAYLTLDRQSRTLSGGEVERVSLTKALGSSLVNTLYVMDEPSIGLHPLDTQRLTQILQKLRDLGNTIILVEHDRDLIAGCDHLVDLGPGAGEHGGNIIYNGPTALIAREPASLTGRYLKGDTKISLPARRRNHEKGKCISIQGAREHNLKEIDICIPLGLMTCITGVSGSGKSTLTSEVLYKGLKRARGVYGEKPGKFTEISGADLVEDVILVDQGPIGRTPRANPLTYVKGYDLIRQLFARQSLAQARGYTAGTFSFNTAGGRCDECKGEGFQKVEMQFLSDVFVTCPVCRGKRFTQDVLEVRYCGKNIHEILELTVNEAIDFF